MKKPNVILVLTDDQGYPDLGCTGNPWIQTPNIDQFCEESFSFNDFHVAPLCAPTRGGLMTGRRALRNGVWATCWGRSMLKNGEYTLGNLFQDNGYKTGMFGKWHLGDNYPNRPEDKGFEHIVAHKGGGVGQTPDFWGNNYFDDTYFTDSVPTSYDGYCTDVWFDQAKKFIAENKDEPFFAYIATNAPHSPYLVEEKYENLYKDNPDIAFPPFYGMITNIDENFGALREFLKENDLEDNTILIFMTDNGSSGCGITDENEYIIKGYGANLRGKKGSYYDGGHKVPFIVRYPNGKIEKGECDDLCMHTDIFPTLASLCDLEYSENLKIDGTSFDKVFKGEKMESRTEFLQYRQNSNIPEKWNNAVLKDKFRLVYGKELYDVSKDPEQKNDIAKKMPELVEEMRKSHEKWWDEVLEETKAPTYIVLGNEKENPTVLNAMDIFEEGANVWSQSLVAKAMQCSGIWNVEFEKTGDYEFVLRRWPDEAQREINNQYTMEEFDKLVNYVEKKEFKYAVFKTAYLKVDDKIYTKEVLDDSIGISFMVENIPSHKTQLEAWFITDKGEKYGAYYVDIERKIK